MANTSMNIRMDAEVKRQAEALFSEIGMNMTTAITIFAKKMCREHRIPFDVSFDPFYSDTNIKSLTESIRQLENGEVVIKTFDDLETMANE